MLSWVGAAPDEGRGAEMARPVRYILIGSVVLIAACGLFGGHLWDGRGQVLKTDGGPVATVMDFGQKLPARSAALGLATPEDFLHGSPMTMSFAVKDGVPSMRFETHDSASMLFRSVDIDLAAYPMLAWRWYIELPIHSPLDERTRA